MRWQFWILAVVMGLNAGWMTFDGLHALITGDYVTPRRGPNAGKLGPWARVVRTLALEPRSFTVKTFFVVYGVAVLSSLACYSLGYGWVATALLLAAAAGVWYLPTGTVLNGIAIILLLSGESLNRIRPTRHTTVMPHDFAIIRAPLLFRVHN